MNISSDFFFINIGYSQNILSFRFIGINYFNPHTRSNCIICLWSYMPLLPQLREDLCYFFFSFFSFIQIFTASAPRLIQSVSCDVCGCNVVCCISLSWATGIKSAEDL